MIDTVRMFYDVSTRRLAFALALIFVQPNFLHFTSSLSSARHRLIAKYRKLNSKCLLVLKHTDWCLDMLKNHARLLISYYNLVCHKLHVNHLLLEHILQHIDRSITTGPASTYGIKGKQLEI